MAYFPVGWDCKLGISTPNKTRRCASLCIQCFLSGKRFAVFSIILCLQKRIFHNVELSALKWQELSRWTKTLHGFWGSFSNKIIRKSVANTLQYLQPSNPISSSWLLSYQILQLWADKPFFLGWCIIVSSPTFVVRIRTWLWLCIWEIGRC